MIIMDFHGARHTTLSNDSVLFYQFVKKYFQRELLGHKRAYWYDLRRGVCKFLLQRKKMLFSMTLIPIYKAMFLDHSNSKPDQIPVIASSPKWYIHY